MLVRYTNAKAMTSISMLFTGRKVFSSAGRSLTRGLSTTSSARPGLKVTYTSPIVSKVTVEAAKPLTSPSIGAISKTQPRAHLSTINPKSSWHSRTYPLSLGLALGVVIFSLLRDDRIHAEGQEGPLIICFVGLPGSGKTTQVNRLKKAFGGFKVIDEAEARDKKHSKDSQIIIDGWPRTLDQAHEFEKRTGTPIFVLVYFDMPQDQWAKRNDGKAGDVYQSSRDSLQPLVDEYRRRGNILEISAEWNDPNEVWEQVEAKVEQVLELRSRGESVAVE